MQSLPPLFLPLSLHPSNLSPSLSLPLAHLSPFSLSHAHTHTRTRSHTHTEYRWDLEYHRMVSVGPRRTLLLTITLIIIPKLHVIHTSIHISYARMYQLSSWVDSTHSSTTPKSIEIYYMYVFIMWIYAYVRGHRRVHSAWGEHTQTLS